MGYLLAAIRLFLFLLIAFSITILIWISRILRLGSKTSFDLFKIAVWLIRFCLNIRVQFHGAIPLEPCVIMANHRSYIDVVLIPSRIPYVIVAKMQVRSWPIVGMAARALKVIFVDRDSAASRRATRNQIVDRIKEKLSILVYPEGTTYRGPGILPFKPGVFSTAVAEGIGVVPVAIEYRDKEMAWIGTDTFVPHFFRSFRKWRIDVDVSMGGLMKAEVPDLLKIQVQEWVDRETRRLSTLQSELE